MYTLFLLALFGSDIHDLGGNTYAVRERAEARLRRYDFLAWRILDLPWRGPERRRRAGRIVRSYLRLDRPPMISALVVRQHHDGFGVPSTKPEIRWEPNANGDFVVVAAEYPRWARRYFVDDGDDMATVPQLREASQHVAGAAQRFGMPRWMVEAFAAIMRARESTCRPFDIYPCGD